MEARFVNHPGICVGYRLVTSNGSIAYLPDNEPYDVLKISQAGQEKASARKRAPTPPRPASKLVDFLRGTDILIIDSQYTDEEYEQKVGLGPRLAQQRRLARARRRRAQALPLSP